MLSCLNIFLIPNAIITKSLFSCLVIYGNTFDFLCNFRLPFDYYVLVILALYLTADLKVTPQTALQNIRKFIHINSI